MPEADLARWSKKLAPFIQSVAMTVNSTELASMPFWVRFPPPSSRIDLNSRLVLATLLLSGPLLVQVGCHVHALSGVPLFAPGYDFVFIVCVRGAQQFAALLFQAPGCNHTGARVLDLVVYVVLVV